MSMPCGCMLNYFFYSSLLKLSQTMGSETKNLNDFKIINTIFIDSCGLSN